MLLAIDTSTRTVGLALYNGVQVLNESVWTSNDYHTVELAPAISEMLERSAIGVSDLTCLTVALGPGSFTGLRIGLAVAKGLALVCHLPIVGIPTLDVLAAAQGPLDIPMAATLRAGRGRLAVGWYQYRENGWEPSSDIEVLTAPELSRKIHAPTLVCGEFSEEERRLLARKRRNVRLASPASCLRRPGFLAELGWQRWQQGEVADPATLAPTYLHYNEPIPG
jgi:tRNA threonylcarbamoyladenosine biosynthesis protein TsaB